LALRKPTSTSRGKRWQRGRINLIGAGYDGDIALPSSAALPWIILIGFAGLIAHFCLATALSIAPASIVMPIDFIRLPVIAVVAASLYSEPLYSLVFVGAAVIFGANYCNITYGQRAKVYFFCRSKVTQTIKT
jgi:hypothetical protein